MAHQAIVLRIVLCGQLLLAMGGASCALAQSFVQLDPPATVSGYLARLLINEAPFPGESGYVSQEDTQAAMLSVLWVLHGRIYCIPPGYRQVQVAGVTSTNIIDVITGTQARPQCEGFYRDDAGRFLFVPRVQARIDYLIRIANSGGKPGRFANLLNFGQGLARAYVQAGIEGADRFAGLRKIGALEVTGRAFSWMTDQDCYNPGGNFVTIPNRDQGSLGGNRFFTLRKLTK